MAELNTNMVEVTTFSTTLPTVASPSIAPFEGDVKEVVLTQGEADIGYIGEATPA